MPAIIMHAGAGVLLIIMTNVASPQPNNKNKKSQITKQNQTIPLPHIRIPNINTTKSAPKTNIHNRRPAPYNKLTEEIQYFQMRKMHQR